MMESGICCKRAVPLPPGIDLARAGRYFGLQGGDAAAHALLKGLAPQILASARPRMVWAEFSPADTPALFAGQDVAAHLAGCSRFVLLGVTLGAETDKAVRRAGIGDVAAQAAADALASALAEQIADTASNILTELYKSERLFLTGRYAPGYGDWPLAAQKQVSALLDLPKNLGVTVTEHYLMLPRKSITAVMGIAPYPVAGRLAGCASCALREKCEYRKRGHYCGCTDTAENR